jgi:hypothetical protein
VSKMKEKSNMTFSEFRAWLEGYSASFRHNPSAQQWAVICEKLEKVVVPQSTTISFPAPAGGTTLLPHINHSNHTVLC